MDSSVETRTPPAQGGRSAALAGYRWLLALFLLAGGAQIFLAGFGVFSFGAGRAAEGSSAFSVHMGLGFGMAGAAVLILILALIGRPGALALWLSGLLVVQTCLLQSLWMAWPTAPPPSADCTPWTVCSSWPTPASCSPWPGGGWSGSELTAAASERLTDCSSP